jgi:methylated-DNA-protein-cysteine methyltransferase-like protein
MLVDKSSIRDKVFEVVNAIPTGRVTSYGSVGAVLGISGWEVGRLLSGLKEELWDSVMWQRVVAKDGFISSMKLGFRGQLQKELLMKEGIEIQGDSVVMDKHNITTEELMNLV